MKQAMIGFVTGVLLVILLNPMVLSTSRMQAMVMLIVTIGAAVAWVRNSLRRTSK
jgi:hypothetical protein